MDWAFCAEASSWMQTNEIGRRRGVCDFRLLLHSTFKGVVQLSGFVRSQADIGKAVEVARGVPGAKSVNNDMRLK